MTAANTLGQNENTKKQDSKKQKQKEYKKKNNLDMRPQMILDLIFVRTSVLLQRRTRQGLLGYPDNMHI
jgi:hypothetical protein